MASSLVVIAAPDMPVSRRRRACGSTASTALPPPVGRGGAALSASAAVEGVSKGEIDVAGLPLRAEAFYRDQRIDLRLGATATPIDRAGARIQPADGSPLPYGSLVLAMGPRQRRFDVPGVGLPGGPRPAHALPTRPPCANGSRPASGLW